MMVGVGCSTLLAGLLFKYDQGIFSGALPLLQVDLDLATLESEIITSWVTLGALFGALVAGGTADRIGRRWTAVGAGALFAVGRVVTGPGVGGRSLEEIQERWVLNGDRMLDEEQAA